MKASKRAVAFLVTGVLAAICGALPCQLAAQTATTESSAVSGTPSPERWSVQVSKVDPDEVNMAASFQIAIYENLGNELNKTKRFEQVLRDGDRRAAQVPNLLTLKTNVKKYTRGSETERAVTTVGGANKLTVRTQLCTADGDVVLERTMHGNVRFYREQLASHTQPRPRCGEAYPAIITARTLTLGSKEGCGNSDPEPWGVSVRQSASYRTGLCRAATASESKAQAEGALRVR